MFIWCHSFESFSFTFSGTDRATLITTEKCIGVYEYVSKCVPSPMREKGTGRCDKDTWGFKKIFCQSRREVEIQQGVFKGSERNVKHRRWTKGSFYMWALSRGSLRDWQNLQCKNKFDCEGKNILIIQSKWNGYKVTAKSKSNTINLVELWYI